MNRLDRAQRRATEIFRGLENLPCKGKWREIVLFILKKRRLSGRLIRLFEYLKGSYKEDGSVFTKAPHREEVRRYKLHNKRLLLDLTKTFFTVRMITHCNNLCRDVVEPHH